MGGQVSCAAETAAAIRLGQAVGVACADCCNVIGDTNRASIKFPSREEMSNIALDAALIVNPLATKLAQQAGSIIGVVRVV